MTNFGKLPSRRGARIQIFVHDLGATGVVRNAIAIANEAADSGYQVRLLTCDAGGVLRANVGPGVAVVRLNQAESARGSRRTQLKKALIAYRKHSRDWAPDIMVSAGNHGHLLSTFAWLGLPGTKVLRFSNDLAHSSPSLPTRLWREARFRLMARLADRLIYVSRAQAEHPLLARQLAAGKAVIIPNGVGVEAVRTAAAVGCDYAWANDKSVPLLLAVGRHVAQKNFATLLKAFALARVERQMRLAFLGEGSASELGRLRTMAAELGVAADVDFVPATANPFPYMAGARALVLPSLWEGSANVLLEAMACGTPVIASRTAGDAAHVLDGGRHGLLVDPLDAERMSAALLRQTGSDPVTPGGRAEQFDRAATMRRYIEMFDRLGGTEALPFPSLTGNLPLAAR